MNNLAQQGLTHNQVLELLNRSKGEDFAEYRIEAIRNGVHIAWVDYTEFSIQCDAESAVKYTGRITMRPDERIDMRKDYLRLVMFYEAGGITLRFPFVPLKAITTSQNISAGILYDVELYDESVMLKDNSMDRNVIVPKGTPYAAAIKQILVDVGFTNITIDPSSKILPTDYVLESGEERLTLVNNLLREVNYNSLEVDISGTLKSSPYISPALKTVDIQYRADRHSLVIPEKSITLDQYKRYNHFIGYCSHPDLDEEWRFEHKNESPGDPISIRNLGYTVTMPPQQFDNVPDQETLGDLVIRMARETSQSYMTATFNTAVMPHHTVNDVILIQSNGLNGRWVETGWEIQIGGDYPTMQHNVGAVNYE